MMALFLYFLATLGSLLLLWAFSLVVVLRLLIAVQGLPTEVATLVVERGP